MPMDVGKQLKAFFLLSIICVITIHKSIPHFHHSHEALDVKIAEVDHSHDNSDHHHHNENSEEESDFLYNLLLGNHSHGVEIEEDSEVLLTSNKVLVGKNLPTITLFTKSLIPKIPKLTSKKEYFESLPNYKQEHQLLHCPLRAPPLLG
jgi:hypothetical protein